MSEAIDVEKEMSDRDIVQVQVIICWRILCSESAS